MASYDEATRLRPLTGGTPHSGRDRHTDPV